MVSRRSVIAAVLREVDSPRLRAGIRGVLPAILSLGVLLAGSFVLGTIALPTGGGRSFGDALLIRFGLAVLYVGMIGVALWGAASLDRRSYTEYGLAIDRRWLRDFGAGVLISGAGIGLSLWWALFRGLRAIDLSVEVSGSGGPIFLAIAFVTFALFILLGNLYEEIVYRGIMIQNFMEGLTARGFSPSWAVVPATGASLVLFGLYHVPLRGNFLVAADAALVGIPFALAYLLTGELGLPLGIHFARISVELIHGWEFFWFDLPAVVELTRTSLMANLELKLLRIGLICIFVLVWVYSHSGELQIVESIYDPDTGNSDNT